MTTAPQHPSLALFSAPTRNWFEQQFGQPTPVQAAGWPVIGGGQHCLLVAPTGSGKTLAAFLWGLDRLQREPRPPGGVRIVYVSPLKALVYDIERNLRAPLAGIAAGNPDAAVTPMPGIDIRTGDTPARERQRQSRQPAEILVTTPESLYLILGSKARAGLRSVEAVIIDEVHALAATKRGAHLALSLERLSEVCDHDPQRIGLTATVNPATAAADYLGGDRPVAIVDSATPPALQLSVAVPVPDMEQTAPAARQGGSVLAELHAREAGSQSGERGIWQALYPELLGRVLANRTTLIFVNSRALCERLALRLNELAGVESGGRELVLAHHGSVSHQRRNEIEDQLKRGEIRGLVATSSLELGIDMGAIDEVLLVESPGTVARGLQRIGRAGHSVGAASRGRIYPKFRGDLLEASVIAQRMLHGRIETLRPTENALDVLAQQISAMVCDRPRTPRDLAALLRRAWPYRQLSDDALGAVLEMLSGHYPSSDFADLRPLLSWDRDADLLSPRRGTPMLVRLNAGTIPDRGLYAVHLGTDGPRIGELDEEMVFETRVGENVLLGASSWHVEQITRDRVVVTPAPGEPGRLPFWRGEGPGRPIELGRALGAFLRECARQPAGKLASWLQTQVPIDALAARNLAAYLDEQQAATGCLPGDRAITVERFRDELGDWRVCLLSPFGARVHAPWALALQHRLSVASGFEVQALYSDDGIALRFADGDEAPGIESLLPAGDELDELVTEQLADSALFAGLFRENAARSLLMPRRRHDGRQPLWAQRLKAQNLLASVRRFPRFPVVVETYRQCLGEIFDMPALKGLLEEIRSGHIRIDEVETDQASPFARSLVFAYVAAYLYEGDAPLAERRAQALTLDRGLLAELLGQAELRDLLDPRAFTDLHDSLQCLCEPRRAGDADQLHDLLRRLGDLSAAELELRCRQAPQAWLQTLQQQKRALTIRLAGEQRWIAAEDAGLYRDAFGCVIAAGLPEAFLDPVAAPLVAVLQRFARSHGPFTTAESAARYALLPAQCEPALSLLQHQGRLMRGEIRPDGSELEWCDQEVLRQLRRLSLARLRDSLAPVAATTLTRFLLDWHGVERAPRQHPGLIPVIARLQGLALPWSSLSQQILPGRLAAFSLDALDGLAAAGEVIWIGQGALGPKDGRICLYLREQIAELLAPPETPQDLPALASRLLETLQQRGACFRLDLERALQRDGIEASARELDQALWDLVWLGLISNDTFGPLRSLGAGAARRRGRDRLAGGRWFCIDSLLDATIAPTRRGLARTANLLERYGIVARETAQAENLSGGFGSLYPVLRVMEDKGRVQRGYFVEGLSGAQFALAGAADRLRGLDEREPAPADKVRIVAAVDPANPYGALLPWPECRGRPRRAAGSLVVLVGGHLALYVGAGWRQILSFTVEAEDLAAACQALSVYPRRGQRRRLIEKIDGQAALDSALRETFVAAGFLIDYNGFAQDPAHA